MEDRRPIGYWLKYLDRLIEDNFDRLLASEGLTRRHWQILTTLHRGPSTRGELVEAVAPFVTDHPDEVDRVIDDLTQRRWAQTTSNDALVLTPEGTSARIALLERVKTTRQQLVRGISEDEYRTVIDVLRRMAANLESTRAGSGSWREPLR